MENYKALILLAILIGGGLFIYYGIGTNRTSNTQTLEAKLITAKSLYENMQYPTNTEYMRLIYEYPRSSVSSDVPYFTVNITIPDNIANQLDQLAEKYPKLKDAFYPRILAAKIASTTTFSYYYPYIVNYIEYTPHGIPKKIQATFVTSDIPTDAKYIVVQIHAPFFEDWVDHNVTFTWDILFKTDPQGQWTIVKADSPIRIENEYGKPGYTPYITLSPPILYNKWVILKRDLDMNIDPYKPLYARWQFACWKDCNLWYMAAVIGLKFEMNDGSTYFVAIRTYGSRGVDFSSLFSNIEEVNCGFSYNVNNQLRDLAADIKAHCDINWTNVKMLKSIYIGLYRVSSYNVYPQYTLRYIWISNQDFVKNETATP